MSPNITLRSKVGAAVAVPVVLAAALATVWVLDQHAQARTRADLRVRATVASSVTVVRTDLRNQLTAAATAQPGSSLLSLSELGRLSVSRSVALATRDLGAAALDDAARPPAIVMPVYRGGAIPDSTAGRRAAIENYLVVPLDMGPVLARLAPEAGGLAVSGPTRLIAADPKPAPAGARRYAVDMDLTGFPGWTVSAWLPDPGVPVAAWFWAGGLLLVGLAVGSLMGLLVYREGVSTQRQWALEVDRKAITGLAPVLQTSLDIGEVIPAVAWHLADSLGLRGLSLATPGEGGERQLFQWGRSPDRSVVPTAAEQTHLAPGETYAVALTRGGRRLGVLRIVAGVELGPVRLVSLATAGELLGSTLANAEAYARQQDLLERMRSVDELKTVFLATASHELRTPVAAIVGFTTLLLEQWETMPPERARTLVDRVASNGRRLNSLIEQLLDFSQLERGLPHAADELLNLGATVSRILSEQGELTAGHELEVVVDGDGLVRGSSSAVERIITNLVGNAAKYSPAGTRITVTVRCEQDTAVLTVDDEGPGVPEADREKIFSRFYRGRGDAVSRTRGAGIGLAIVTEYAESMSGTAGVQTSPAGGARLVVTFPAVALPLTARVEGRLDVALS